MFGLFKKKAEPGIVVLTLKARLQPNDRGELTDAFEDFCRDQGIEAAVVGGGTLMQANGEIDCCDIEVELPDTSEEKVARVLEVFTAMLAPKGSYATLPDGRQIPFGTHEGLALYINGTDLPPEVYANHDINHVFNECDRLLKGYAMVHSYWSGEHETALYMYGASYAEIERRIAPFVDSYPLCAQSRRVQIA